MLKDDTLIKNTKWERLQKKTFQKAHQPLQETVDIGKKKGYEFNSFTQDLFSSLYQIEPEFPEEDTTPGKHWHKQALDTLKDLREYRDLRNTGTVCDSFQSGLGASIISKNFLEKLEARDDPDDIQAKIDAWQDFVNQFPDSKRAEEAKQKIKRFEKRHKKALKDAQTQAAEVDSQAVRIAMRSAIVAAKQEIDEIEEATAAYGYGTEPGTDGYTSAEEKMQIANLIKDNPKLREIANLAGRFRREARKVQANKKVPGNDELTDIETGADLGRLVPAELMKLKNRYLKLEFGRKMLERNLIQYKMESVEHKDRGPIVVCIDNSGSMAGQREIWSKAIALAMCQIAVDQRRMVEIIHFDTEVRRKEVLDPINMHKKSLLDSMLYFSNGGTKFGPPLGEAFRDIVEAKEKDLGDADVIFITDGYAPLSDEGKALIQESKKITGASLYTMQIGGERVDLLEEISDEVFKITDLNADNNELKDTIFSI